MAMSGLRDMSTIEEPPFERRPIETYVMEYDAGVVAAVSYTHLALNASVIRLLLSYSLVK